VENAGGGGRTKLEDALAGARLRPRRRPWVIDSHLHFDHAGGNYLRDPTGRVALSFPRARYVAQRGEAGVRAAIPTSAPPRANLPPNSSRFPFTLIDGRDGAAPGIRCLPTPGHVPITVDHDRERRRAGVLPSQTSSRPRPSAAPLDHGIRPGAARDARVEATPVCAGGRKGWLLVFEHDPAVVAGRLGRDGKGVCHLWSRSCGLNLAPTIRKRAPSAPHPLPLRLGECSRVPRRT